MVFRVRVDVVLERDFRRGVAERFLDRFERGEPRAFGGAEATEGVETSSFDAEPVEERVELPLDDEVGEPRRTFTAVPHERQVTSAAQTLNGSE